MIKFIRYLIVTTIFLQLIITFAQSANHSIKGYVIDAKSGESLPYANVAVAGKKTGTTTNTEGYFILLNIPSDADTLEIFYIGYTTKKIAIDKTDFSKPLIVKMKQNLLETEAITVTAEEYQIWEKSEHISQITFSPKQLTSLPSLGEVDIFRSLQLLPGISGISDGSAGLYIRGGTPDQNLVLLDGMTVYHVDHFFGFFSAFNADAIKNVQVYKGGFPAMYGGRLSSVVDLTGKTGNVNKAKYGFGINLLSINGIMELPMLNNKASLIVSGRRSYTDIIQTGAYENFYDSLFGDDNNPISSAPRPGGGRRGQMAAETRPDFYYYDLNAKFSYTPTRKDVFALSFYSGKDKLDDTQEMGGLKSPSTGESMFTRINEEKTDWGNIGASAKWSRQWNDRFSGNILFSSSEYESNYDRNRRVENEGISDSTVVTRGGAFASEENNKINDLTFRFDGDWHLSASHRLDFGTWISGIKTDYAATLNDTINLFSRSNNSAQYAFYLQDRWQIFTPLEINFGIRSTYYDKTARVYNEPRVSFSYAITNKIKFKGAWGHYYQFIHRIVNEEILGGSRDFWLVADGDFKPEYSEHYISGISYENKDYLFSIEAFYKSMDNLIEYSRRFQTKADYGELFFFGSGISKGVEFLAQKKAGAFNGWLSYTLSSIDLTFPNFNNGITFPANYDRTHEFKTVATYAIGKWNLAATWVYASGQPYTSPESQYFLELLNGETQSYIHVSDKNSYFLPDYMRMDISVSYHFYDKSISGKRKSDSWSGEAGLSIFNLFNHDNIWYRKYDLDVTPVVITDVKMLGFTPTIFLKMNF